MYSFYCNNKEENIECVYIFVYKHENSDSKEMYKFNGYIIKYLFKLS